MSGESRNERTLSNESFSARLAIEDGVVLRELRDQVTGQSLLSTAGAFCDPEPAGIPTLVDARDNALRVVWRTDSGPGAELTLDLEGPRLRWQWAEFAARHNPFLDVIKVGHGPDQPDRVVGADRFVDGRGRSIFRNGDWPLPTAWIAANGRTVTLLPAVTADDDRTNRGTGTSAGASDMTELVVHDGGWPAAFDLFRQRIRARFDLAQYARPDLDWYRDQLVQHFTFLYGREILNLETGEFEIERFLDEAERDFGGYDGMLVWGVYPRIGVDERTQWDFHDDFPGGRAGLRAMARRARERGVRFFVPFKPWDVSAEQHGRPAEPPHERLAQLVADVEADGVFLDTMSAIDPQFRDALDEARPGVVFCSEGRAKGRAFEIITGSWDQSLYHDTNEGDWSAAQEMMPGVDLWRFVFPEHPLFVINRHAIAADRLRIIERGFFGGMGWVVWQDIFGLVLPFAPEETALLKRCRTIAREHLSALRSACPTPLVETLVPGVYANEFPVAGKRFWTLYNANDRPVTGPMLRLHPGANRHLVDVWADEEAEIDEQGRLKLTLNPGSVGAVAELPRLLACGPGSRQVMADAPVGATIELRRAGASTSHPADRGPLDLAPQVAGTGEPLLVRLLADGELLDQIVVRPEAWA